MSRAPCGVIDEKGVGLKKGPWTPEEDHKLVAYVQKHGLGSWRSLPLNAGLQRCGKSCRLRWTNYLRPDIKRGRFSQDEEQIIVHLHAILGNRWSAIASHLPCRTDNEIKNYWNTHLKRRLVLMGIDPMTHKSTEEEQLVLDSIMPGLRPLVSSNLTHMSQWDSFRAEAEARLSGQSSPSSELVHKPPNQGDTSTTYMRSWKTQVAETLRPCFGALEPDKSTPVNFQTFLQDWESSLQGRTSASLQGQITSPTVLFSTYGSPIEVPDLSSNTPSGTVSPQYDPHAQVCQPMFPPPTSAEISERLLQCRGFDTSFPLETTDTQPSFRFATRMCCGDNSENPFSPTSTLHDHDSSGSYTDSPGISNFDVQVQQELVFPQVSSLWSRQQADSAWSFNGVNPVMDMANGIPIPKFDSLV